MATKKEATNSAAAEPEVKKKPGKKTVTAAEKEAAAVAAAEPKGNGKPGRKKMTDAEKAAAAKVRAQEKAKAENLKPEFIVQYQGADIDLSALAEAAKANFREVKKRTLITEMKLYVKPEEHTVYYVINGDHTGSIAY